jgi:hypothetical protein
MDPFKYSSGDFLCLQRRDVSAVQDGIEGESHDQRDEQGRSEAVIDRSASFMIGPRGMVRSLHVFLQGSGRPHGSETCPGAGPLCVSSKELRGKGDHAGTIRCARVALKTSIPQTEV